MIESKTDLRFGLGRARSDFILFYSHFSHAFLTVLHAFFKLRTVKVKNIFVFTFSIATIARIYRHPLGKSYHL